MSNRGAAILAVALLLCAIVYALTTRYGLAGDAPVAYEIDRWTGQVWLLVRDREVPVLGSPRRLTVRDLQSDPEFARLDPEAKRIVFERVRRLEQRR